MRYLTEGRRLELFRVLTSAGLSLSRRAAIAAMLSIPHAPTSTPWPPPPYWRKAFLLLSKPSKKHQRIRRGRMAGAEDDESEWSSSLISEDEWEEKEYVPRLPPELELEVFQLAAEASIKDVPPMLRVAKRFEWLRSYLFTTIVINPDSPSLLALLHLLDTLPPFHPFLRDGRVARSVFVGDRQWLTTEVMRILCTFGKNVQDLTMLTASRAIVALLGTKGMPLKRLAICLAHLSDGLSRQNRGCYRFPNLARAPGAFAHVTHLELFDVLCDEPVDTWAYLLPPTSPIVRTLPVEAPLPALTHLCVHSFVHRQQLRFVRQHCPQLEVLVNAHQNTEPELGLADIAARLGIDEDVRFVLMTVEMSLGAQERRWEAARKGLGMDSMGRPEAPKDFWRKAEAFVRLKREGKVIPASRCWVMDEDEV
uniref:F-box domain-containing protein n=1 Tax=Mycena chlorophos TaxID=658473 RepID=A0ABQ0L0X0_MYCCL|nr:predicted protein [Mycena chlorophos]